MIPIIILKLLNWKWKPIYYINNFYILLFLNIIKLFNNKYFIFIKTILFNILLYNINNKDIFVINFLLIISNFIKHIIKNLIKINRPYFLYIRENINKKSNNKYIDIYLGKIKNISFDILNIEHNIYYSFPSGHSILFSMYIFLIYKIYNNKIINKYIFIIYFILYTINLYTRIFLGLHYLIDVLFGILISFILINFYTYFLLK
ncbi:phosphatidylglycerophosphatase [endosymbiont of Sipalinus gigas]|nr:phosphatidylglycerophosphatase [endosymbiont of Sipalinus gigas]